jgi:hypothetical protein
MAFLGSISLANKGLDICVAEVCSMKDNESCVLI